MAFKDLDIFGFLIVKFQFLGEDRWLCTLLLQEGYRVEYCAASDALTYAPETFHVKIRIQFNLFYN